VIEGGDISESLLNEFDNIQFVDFVDQKKKENATFGGIRSSTTEVHDCFVRVSFFESLESK
jgi:hypothetical protein